MGDIKESIIKDVNGRGREKKRASGFYRRMVPNLPLGRQGHKVANIGEAAAAAVFFVVNPEGGGQGFRAGDAGTA